jgi:hypothetical protein
MDFPTIPNPVGALVVGVIGTIAAGYYGAWWLAFGLLVFSILTGVHVFRRARKIYREGSWQPN